MIFSCVGNEYKSCTAIVSRYNALFIDYVPLRLLQTITALCSVMYL